MTARPPLTPLALTLLTAAGAVVIGCSASHSPSGPATRGDAPDDQPRRTEPATPRDDETRQRLALMEQAMANAERVDQAFRIQDPPPTTEGEARTDFWRPVDVEGPPGETSKDSDPALVEADGVASRPAEPGISRPAQPPLTRDQRIRKNVAELAALVRDDAREIGFMLPAWLRIAALETIEPGTLSAHYLPGVGSAGPAAALSEPEHDFLIAWRDLHTGVWENADSADVAHLAALVDDAAQRMSALRPLEIARAALCTKVERYGVYNERKRYDGVHKIIAGSPQRLLVYMELENYAHRETVENGIDGHAVDLTVGLSLHHLGRERDLLAWRMADERLSVFSRNLRREFFLTIIADLPETLSVDAYNLKARVTDENSGAVAEHLIRVDIVADTSAFTSTSR